jgi:hypothetical protein
MGNNMKFKNYLNEGKNQYLYHGQNYPGNPFPSMAKRLSEGNQQEGPGIYFGDLKTAESYGKYIWKTVKPVNQKDFLKSRASVSSQRGFYKHLPKFLRRLWKKDPEPMFYELSNWVEIQEPEDIKNYHFDLLAEKLKYEEVRNFLITYADLYSGKDFLEAFNFVYPRIKGTYNPELNFYAFLKPVDVIKVENEI